MQSKFIFCWFLVLTSNSCQVSCQKVKLKFSCTDLHMLFDESKHFVNLRRIQDNLLRRNHVTLSAHEIGFEYFKAKSLNFNISENYLKAEIYTQMASLFYDQINYKDYDNEIPALLQNYSFCFLDQNAISPKSNLTHGRYRNIDGSNNSLKNSTMGSSFTSFSRFIPANYDDKIHSVRKSIRGYNLPSPRNIVRKLFLNDEVHLNKFSGRKEIPNMLSVMFGHFISNDLSYKQAAQYIDGGEEGIRCCAHYNKIQLPASLQHSACLPIIVSRSDPFYSPQNIKCMGFVRSNMISNNPNKVDVGEKANTVTSFLDLSTIYGSEYQIMREVRSENGGRLRTNRKNVLRFGNGTYMSGDNRVNQTPLLAMWHSIFVRNHNFLADRLAGINSHWSKEKIFQEARGINIAIYQKIVYEEWLNIFLGTNASRRFENTDYDENIDASISNDFAAGAFRFMHSFISSHVDFYKDEMKVKILNFSDTIMRAKLLENYYDEILEGLLRQKINLAGYSSEILNKLFKGDNDIGLDLLSIDILRGRDHGLSPYHKYRKICNMRTNVKMFNDLSPHISSSAITQLRQTYKSVYDIDLLVGGALETIEDSKNETLEELGFFGPTFRCIISEQFFRLKAGDFYFYTHQKRFTSDQMEFFKTYTLQNLLCKNVDDMTVQEKAFLVESDENKARKCHNFPPIDLTAWQENSTET